MHACVQPDWAGMKVAQLKQHAEARGLSAKGRKADLVARLAAPPAGPVQEEASPMPSLGRQELGSRGSPLAFRASSAGQGLF